MPIIINNMKFSGQNVSISGNRIMINGKDITNEIVDAKEYNITINGNCENLSCDEANQVEVKGSVNELKTMSGKVSVGGNVNGNVKTMSGNVSCKNIDGNVKTMSGNISRF